VDVALITEGTYPTAHGGVSVWCDQLVSGMSADRFDVYAITGTPAERPVWSLPANVRHVELIPLWGGHTSIRPRRLARRDRQRFSEVYERFVWTLIAPEPDVVSFLDSLRGLWEFAQTADLAAAFRSEEAISRLLESWHRAMHLGTGDRMARPTRLRPSVADAVNATSLMEHCLRPLLAPAPQVDVTHSAANGLGALVALTAKWTYGTPFILTEHGVYLRERYLAYRKSTYSAGVKQFILRFFKLLTDAAYHVADLITPGNAYNKRWALRGGAQSELIRTVYNGVEPADFPEALGEPDAPTISFMGRIDPIKDVETLVEAFGHVHREMPEARLRIFGGAPKGGEAYAERCRDLSHRLGLDEVCTFEGRVDHARTAYAAGHVVALTSISEGFPYTVVEAMMSGRTTVSTDVGGVCEAVGDTGLLVPPRHPEAFAAACLELLRDDERRQRLAREARKRALEMFTLDHFLSLYRGIYDEVGGVPPAGVIDLNRHRRTDLDDFDDFDDDHRDLPTMVVTGT
jgi:glycosyltransferase involved in cell wall biosynthesis